MDYSWIGITRAHLSNDDMMRASSILKWQSKPARTDQNGWIHPPGALQGAHVVYLVKFLGCTEVDSPKGMEVVKAGITKMRFNAHVKRSEGSKISKVELTISIDGVAIQEPKTKKIMYQYPLYRISFCADDKAEKKFFCFIVKEEEEGMAKHRCFVFVSDRLAENITLTIGQAFDLAYRRFLETSSRDLEMRKQLIILQKKTMLLEQENFTLRARLAELERSGPSLENRSFSEDLLLTRELPSESLTEKISNPNFEVHHVSSYASAQNGVFHDHYVPASEPPAIHRNDFHLQSTAKIFNPPPLPPRPGEGGISPPVLTNGLTTNGKHANGSDLITLDPFAAHAASLTAEEDPFGDFKKLFTSPERSTSQSNLKLDEAIQKVDKRINDMKEGFGRGIAFEHEDFLMDALDPIGRNKQSTHA
ncbi:hypothetical protein RvY_01071 [Ramazzottius varieornatus]|uniref:PID domain-containing protein n=1 Tax=Ramazzottius varieornatus TaxID=947166 RepID=A0A1D1UIM0_RAMVA|nr:hypothetical protein RvY_01071 [Ramazzottius varieornatus]